MNRSLTLAAAVAFVAAASRAVVDWRIFRPDSVPIGQVLALFVFAVVLAHAVWMACRACSGEQGAAGTAPRTVWWLWLGVLVIGLIVWPAAFQPDRFALASLLFFGSLAAFPAAVADGLGRDGRLARWVVGWRRAGSSDSRGGHRVGGRVLYRARAAASAAWISTTTSVRRTTW